MLKNLCFCSGQHCTTSTTSIKVNAKPIKKSNSKPQILVASENKIRKIENLDKTAGSDNSKYSEDSNSLTVSYPSSISNSIHFYHPKSIESTHFTEMSSGKKISSFNYISSNETSEVTLFSSIPSSSTFSEKPGIENNTEKIKKLISLTKKRLSTNQSASISDQGSNVKNTNMQELKLLKKINSYQFSVLKNKFNKSDKSRDGTTERLIRKSFRPVESKIDLTKSNNVDIYESINFSVNNIDSNTVTISKVNFHDKEDLSEEFQKDSLNSDGVCNINHEPNETGISSDSFDKIPTSELPNNFEAVPFIHETYNNIISGNEITYVPNKQALANNCPTNNKRSEFFIKIEGTSSKIENINEKTEPNKNKNLKRIKKPETRKRIRVELKKDCSAKNIDTCIKNMSGMSLSKIEDLNLRTNIGTKQKHLCNHHKKGK